MYDGRGGVRELRVLITSIIARRQAGNFLRSGAFLVVEIEEIALQKSKKNRLRRALAYI